MPLVELPWAPTEDPWINILDKILYRNQQAGNTCRLSQAHLPKETF